MTPDRLPNGKLGALEYFFRHRRLSSTQEYEAIADDVAAAIAELRALREENAALRRVAEAAERDVADARAACGHFADVPHCHSAPYDRTCSDCPYDLVRETDEALADWRRVRGDGEQ